VTAWIVIVFWLVDTPLFCFLLLIFGDGFVSRHTRHDLMALHGPKRCSWMMDGMMAADDNFLMDEDDLDGREICMYIFAMKACHAWTVGIW